ncbi:MAG: BON domain-containing protein [Pseudomonadota bacterium]
MLNRIAIATVLAVSALTVLPGCAVTRGQESVGNYIDDSAITTAVKAKFVDAKTVDASSISVETMKGTVLLTGFAKNERERVDAEALARDVKGVKSVSNRIIVRN